MVGHMVMAEQLCSLVTRVVFVWVDTPLKTRETILGYCRAIIDKYSKENGDARAVSLVSDLQTLLRILG